MAESLSFWASPENQIFLNPALSEATQDRLRLHFSEICKIQSLKAHIGILSSGTTSGGIGKIIFLSKSAFLAAAQGANAFLSARSQDRWLASIPTFHVGGLSIFARAYLTESTVIEGLHKWNPNEFCKHVDEYQVSLTSLVPTQVFDILQAGLKAPKSLRAILVGGAALNPLLYKKARDLNWSLLPSYGATEVCSQIATASLESLKQNEFPAYHVLPHIDARTSNDGRLEVSSAALFTGSYDIEKKLWIRREADFYTLEDFVELKGRELLPKGRGQDFIKILGEGVQVSELEQELYALAFEKNFFSPWTLVAIPEERKGFDLVFVASAHIEEAKILVNEWNSSHPVYERIKSVENLPQLPQTALGKIQKTKVIEWLTKA